MVEKRMVWDLPTRLFHWLLSLDILGLYLTGKPGDPILEWHFRLGYIAIGLVAFRVIWGFIGPRQARFSTFLVGPRRVFAYLKQFSQRDTPASPGHNPLGALMVILLLIMVGLQGITGLFNSDDIVFAGPYNGAVSGETASVMAAIHQSNSDLLLYAIGLHVLAVLFYLFYKRQNLMAAMLHGRKPAHVVPETEAIASSQMWKALILVGVITAMMWWVVTSAPPPVAMEYY